MKYDYQYVNQNDAFQVVRFTFEGEFLCIDCDPSDEVLAKMENMEDVDGWKIEDL